MTLQPEQTGRRLDLHEGVYESLYTPRVAQALETVPHFRAKLDEVSDDSLSQYLTLHLSHLISDALQNAEPQGRRAQLAVAERIISALGDEYASDAVRTEPYVRMLSELRPDGTPPPEPRLRPTTPFSEVNLLTNGSHEPSIGPELRLELDSADRVDLLCAFIKWTGLRTLDAELKALRDRRIPFRVITTTYIGATERKALDHIVRHYGGQVRVNYTTTTTRLHAKAWLFHRNSGLSTAYVGSSNLSRAALLDGLEWNVRLSEVVTPSLMRKFQATFNSYWKDQRFENYDPDRDAERLDAALQAAANRSGGNWSRGEELTVSGLDVTPYVHQQIMLDELNAERHRGHHKNLLVAATGTGKTVIAALDYRDQVIAAGGQAPTLLFVAHRKEILQQALSTYRNVLKDGAFGELFVDGRTPRNWKHVFASVQSLKPEVIQRFPSDAFEIVVVDEFHHAAAPSYTAILKHLDARQVLGLTATPERTDGTNVKELFDGRIASELRLWDALEAELLVPFHYFALADDVDLTDVAWKGGQYDAAALGKLYTGDHARARKIVQAVQDKVSDLADMKALGFCATVEHARFMAEYFSSVGIPAAVVVGATDRAERKRALKQLASGEIKAVFGVDVFNEGVDIPAVNTVLFLRPTQSATVFLQQLGRGLRLSPGKTVLTALDFVGHQRAEFRFDLKLRAVTGGGRKQLQHDIENNFPFLPSGSQIVLDQVAQEIILENVRQQVAPTKKQLLQDIRLHAGYRSVWEYSLSEYLAESGRSLADVMRPGTSGRNWTTLRRDAVGDPPWGEISKDDERQSLRALHLRHVDDPDRADAYIRLLTSDIAYADLSPRDQQYARMLYFTAIHDKKKDYFTSFDHGLSWARSLPGFVEETQQLLRTVVDRARTHPEPLGLGKETVLLSHAHYRREEILAGLDIATWESKQAGHREGVAWSSAYQTDAFLVTLKKDAQKHSPSTMYRDYAVSRSQFHWESQSTLSANTPTGQRYLAKQTGETHTVMFVRGAARDDIGEGAAYLCLGTVTFGEWSQTERPMQFTWELDREMPALTFQEASAIA